MNKNTIIYMMTRFEAAQEDEVTVKANTKWSLNNYAKVDLGIAKYHFEIGLEEAGRIADTTYEIRWA